MSPLDRISQPVRTMPVGRDPQRRRPSAQRGVQIRTDADQEAAVGWSPLPSRSGIIALG